MRILFSISLLFFAVVGMAQQPTMLSLKGYGGDGFDGFRIAAGWKTFDDGFILALNSYSDAGSGNIDTFCSQTGSREMFLKFDAEGALQSSKCLLNIGDTILIRMYPLLDGNTVYGGTFTSGQGWGFYIAKHDVSGNIIWSRSYSKGMSPLLRAMIQTSDGGYIMAGVSYYTDTNVAVHYGSWSVDDIWVLKLDSFGNKEWSTVIGGTGYDGVRQVVETDNGEFFVVGNTTSTDYDFIDHHGGFNDGFITRLDANGNIIWRRCLGGSGIDGISAACSNGAGGVIMAGITTSSDGDVHNSAPDTRWWALEIDNNNNILWENCFGGGEVNSVCKATDGSIWIGGYSQDTGGQVYTAFGHHDAYLAHIDGSGNFINSVVLGSSNDDEFKVVYPLSNNLVLSGGIYNNDNGSFTQLSFYSDYDAFLALFAPWSTAVPEISSNKSPLSLYPNPASEAFTIGFDHGEARWLSVTDVLGREVFSSVIFSDQNRYKVDVRDWQSGVYYVQLKDATGQREVAKLIIE